MLRATFSVSVSVFVCATLPAQVIPVSGGGDALRIAVQNAPNHAILEVAPGIYNPFQGAGHLTVVAPQGATIQLAPGASGPGYVDIAGSSSAQPFTLVGLDVTGVIFARDAHLEGCTTRHVSVQGGTLVMADCSVTGLNGFVSTEALVAVNAYVALTDSTFRGGYTQDLYGTFYAAAAIDLRSSVMRAERIQAESGDPVLPGTAITLADYVPLGTYSEATIADSVLLAATAVGCVQGSNSVTISGTVTGYVAGACQSTFTLLTTLRWLTQQWTPGGTSTLRSQLAPASLSIVVVSPDAVPFSAAILAELSFVGGTPDWFVHAVGVSNPLGEFDFTVTLPSSPSLLYASAWFHAVSIAGPQLHVSAPLGGLVR